MNLDEIVIIICIYFIYNFFYVHTHLYTYTHKHALHNLYTNNVARTMICVLAHTFTTHNMCALFFPLSEDDVGFVVVLRDLNTDKKNGFVCD